MKNLSTIALLLFMTFGYSQVSKLFQNINYRAAELKHNLNVAGDSLILKGERKIENLTIFNNNFEKSFEANNRNLKIPLKEIPLGRFAVEVKLKDKLIVLTLLRNDLILDSQIPPITENVEKAKPPIKLESSAILTDTSPYAGKSTKKPTKYWIVYTIRQAHASRKSMRMGDEEVVERMIKQHQLDLKTKSGKLNELTIWEVYDSSKFFRYKRTNPDLADVGPNDSFNEEPYYNTLTDAKQS